MWQMCETDSLRFIAFCCDNDDGDDDEHHDNEESLKTDPDLILPSIWYGALIQNITNV